jgi:hypothetical protein
MGCYMVCQGKPGLCHDSMPDQEIQDSAVTEREHADRPDT